MHGLLATSPVFEDCQGCSHCLFKGKTCVVYVHFMCRCAKSLMNASVLELIEARRTFHFSLT